MERILGNLEPKSVFKHFEDLSKIPRCSGEEKAVSDFLVSFAQENGLEVIQEDCLNVIIKKPATAGYEKAPTVILQGHMDMVCVKREDLDFDFSKDPIPLILDGDMIKTAGTTLGADNGIAVAMIMAILEAKDLPHPPLEALLTVEEETGMDGVLNLDPRNLSGKILINLDSEEEGVVLASCAGGVRNIVHLPVKWQEADPGKAVYKLVIKGLRGGHSGIEIDKNRANAIKLLGRVLLGIDKEINIDLAWANGGEKMNAIAKWAEAGILVEKGKVSQLNALIEEYQAIISNEFATADPGIKIYLEEGSRAKKVMAAASKEALIRALRLIPNGVQTMSADVEGLVESSNNIGILSTEEEEVLINSAIRSSVRSLKKEINERIAVICELVGAEMELQADYPEWQYKPDSPLRDLMAEVYKEMYGQELKVEAVHAGLECGFLKEKLGDLDMVSIGPNVYAVHTPAEHLSVSSTGRVFEFLCQVLKRLK